jgi:hypothetical protein
MTRLRSIRVAATDATICSPRHLPADASHPVLNQRVISTHRARCTRHVVKRYVLDKNQIVTLPRKPLTGQERRLRRRTACGRRWRAVLGQLEGAQAAERLSR